MSDITKAALSGVNIRRMLTLSGELHVGDTNDPDTVSIWRDFGNTGEVKYNPNTDIKTTMVTRRGVKRPGKTFSKSINPKYEVMSNELSDQLLRLVHFTDENFDFDSEDNAQAGLNAAAGRVFAFNESSNGKAVAAGDRTDILDTNGNHVFAVTAIALIGAKTVYGAAGASATLAEGVDYELDGDLGQILWLKAIADDSITSTITSATISDSSPNYMRKHKPNRKTFIERICRVFFFDQDEASNWAMANMDFLCRIVATDGYTANADSDAEAKVEITVLTDGYILIREN